MRHCPRMRSWFHRTTNALLRTFGVRLVHANWGPRGAMDALRRARASGVDLRQIVDVGASNGSWTRDCLRIFPEARYLLIEPLPAHAEALAGLHAEHPNVEVWQGGLGSSAGEFELLAHGDQSSFLRSQSFPAQRAQRVEV